MSNVITVVTRIFSTLFITNSYLGDSVIHKLILCITQFPLLFLGVCFVILGFIVSVLKRIIYS